MRRRDFISLLSVTAAYTFPAIAQSKAIPRIAIIGSLNQGAIDALKDSLREFGLVDSETIIVVGAPAGALPREGLSKRFSPLISKIIFCFFPRERAKDKRL